MTHIISPATTPISPKVTAATVAAPTAVAASVVLVWALESITGQDIPALVEGAFPVLLAAVATFVAGYLTRDPARHASDL